MTMRKGRARQRGLSLIELMVALAISSFLILGITQLFIDNKRNYLFQQGRTGSVENGRFMTMLLEQQLTQTGYRAEPWVSLENAFPALGSAGDCPAFSAGETVKLSADGQSLCLRYQGSGDETIRDCLGNTVAVGTSILTQVSYSPGATTDTGTLTCSAQGQAAQTMVSGLAGFVFSGAPAADSDSLVIRYAALLASPENLRNGVKSTAIERWNALSEQELEDDESHVYQIVQDSVTLRNLMR